jgi:hypothetical protein
MSRNFSHPRAGNFCIQIEKSSGGKMLLHYEVLNLQDNTIVRQRLFNKTKTLWWNRFNFGHLPAGTYQLTFRNISVDIVSADLCSSMVTELSTTDKTKTICAGKRLKKVTTPSLPTPQYCRLDRKFFIHEMSHRYIFSQGSANATLKSMHFYNA